VSLTYNELNSDWVTTLGLKLCSGFLVSGGFMLVDFEIGIPRDYIS